MKIYRVHSLSRLVEGQPMTGHDTRYFYGRDNALREAEHDAMVFAAIAQREPVRHDVNQFSILTVWSDSDPQSQYEVRVEEGTVEDAEEFL